MYTKKQKNMLWNLGNREGPIIFFSSYTFVYDSLEDWVIVYTGIRDNRT